MQFNTVNNPHIHWYLRKHLNMDLEIQQTQCYFPSEECFYLVDISKRSLTELTLQPEAPLRSSSCSQSEADSNQFMSVLRRRLLRNCFISVERKWFKHLINTQYLTMSVCTHCVVLIRSERPRTVYEDIATWKDILENRLWMREASLYIESETLLPFLLTILKRRHHNSTIM